MAFSEHRRWIISVFGRRSIMNRLYWYPTSRWDTFVSFHLYGNKGVSLPLWPTRPRWFHTYSPCAEPLGDGHEGMWARFGSQGSIALNWHSRYSGTRYSGTWLYMKKLAPSWYFNKISIFCFLGPGRPHILRYLPIMTPDPRFVNISLILPNANLIEWDTDSTLISKRMWMDRYCKTTKWDCRK